MEAFIFWEGWSIMCKKMQSSETGMWLIIQMIMSVPEELYRESWTQWESMLMKIC